MACERHKTTWSVGPYFYSLNWLLLLLYFTPYSLCPIPAASIISPCLFLCLVYLHAVTDRHLRHVSHHPLYMSSTGSSLSLNLTKPQDIFNCRHKNFISSVSVVCVCVCQWFSAGYSLIIHYTDQTNPTVEISWISLWHFFTKSRQGSVHFVNNISVLSHFYRKAIHSVVLWTSNQQTNRYISPTQPIIVETQNVERQETVKSGSDFSLLRFTYILKY